MIKRLLPLALLFTAHTALAESADREFITTYTNVESVVEAKQRLGRDDVTEADLLRTHYVVEKDTNTQKVVIRPLDPTVTKPYTFAGTR